MEAKKYSSNQDYCNTATDFQSVPSFDQYHQKNPDTPIDKVDVERASTLYSCPDDYHMGSIQDDQIYIATTDAQHDQIAKGEPVNAHGGLSGYFSDQATIDACKDGEALDNTKYNEMCQIAPYRAGGIEGEGDATYKPHVDCFDIDRDALYENYGTHDFNAAISKCEANNQFGAGGGNQGYNPYINEMVENGTLKHNQDNSYSDGSISQSEYNNPNELSNSVVPEDKVENMYDNAQTRAQDCVNNNTPHPSPEACNNGYTPNENPIPNETGNARSCNEEEKNSNTTQTPMQKEARNADEIVRNETPAGSEEHEKPPTLSEVAPKTEGNTDQQDNSDTLKNVADENNLEKPSNNQDNGIKNDQNLGQ